MTNFLEFIEEDAEVKKTLFSTLPSKTKSEIEKYNKKVDVVYEKYSDYKEAVKKYIYTKSDSFEIKQKMEDLDGIYKRISNSKYVSKMLNPSNTFVEKMGFDSLIYEISNCYDFNFDSLIETINEIIKKFELAGIKLSSEDFNYTCYVNEYMISFFNFGIKDRNEISKTFEKIYWVNPDIVEHIELNFRKLIKKNAKTFEKYIVGVQNKIKTEKGIESYKKSLNKLKETYEELTNKEKENIADILILAKKGEIDINNYFIDSKIRTSTYEELMIDPLKIEEESYKVKFYKSLETLRMNVKEYREYLEFMPLFQEYQKEYQKEISNDEIVNNKNLKIVESEISKKESALDKLNKKIFDFKRKENEYKNNKKIKQLKIDSINEAKTLGELYEKYDQEYFKDNVLKKANKSVTVSEVLSLYYSFDYFKKSIIKKVFEIEAYKKIVAKSKLFDEFATNPYNIIINGVSIFEESNIDEVIINKYRLENIKLSKESLSFENLETLLNKIEFLLRIEKIDKSPLEVEKIKFIVQIDNFKKAENKGK